MTEESADEVVEYDLTDWDEDAHNSLEWMLRGRDVVFEWERPGVLIVRDAAESVVDEFVDCLAAGPVALATEDDVTPQEFEPAEWISLDDFLAADPARAASEEVAFGDQWRDDADIRYELHWVHDTGELYLLAMTGKWFSKELYLEVLGRIPGRENVEGALYGWEQAMDMDHSVGWLRAQIAAAQDRPDDEPEPPPEPESGVLPPS